LRADARSSSGQAGAGVAPQQAPLPDGEIAVLQRQLGQIRRSVVERGPVEDGQLAEEQGLRPAVGNDVVDRDQEHVVVRGHAEQQRAQGQIRGQIEGANGLLPGDLVEAREGAGLAGILEID